MSLQNDIKKPSVFWLAGSNLILLSMAIIFKWRLYDVLLVFWFETFVIGVLNILKMIKVPFAAKIQAKLDENKEMLPEAQLGKIGFFFAKVLLIQLFLIIYLGYTLASGFIINGIFAYEELKESASIFDFAVEDKWGFAIACLSITISHVYSYKKNFIDGEEYKSASLKKLLLSPFRRLFLVWVIIIGGGFLLSKFGSESLLLLIPYFLAKILIDIRQHIKEHKRTISNEVNNS